MSIKLSSREQQTLNDVFKRLTESMGYTENALNTPLGTLLGAVISPSVVPDPSAQPDGKTLAVSGGALTYVTPSGGGGGFSPWVDAPRNVGAGDAGHVSFSKEAFPVKLWSNLTSSVGIASSDTIVGPFAFTVFIHNISIIEILSSNVLNASIQLKDNLGNLLMDSVVIDGSGSVFDPQSFRVWHNLGQGFLLAAGRKVVAFRTSDDCIINVVLDAVQEA